nr:hypothetical protein [Herbidospora yilanensis]
MGEGGRLTPLGSPAQAVGVPCLVVQRAAQKALDEFELGETELEKLGSGVIGDRPPDLLYGFSALPGQMHHDTASVHRVTDPFDHAGSLQPVDGGGRRASGETGGGRQFARGERAARGQSAQTSQVGAVDAKAPGCEFVDEVGGILQFLNGPGDGLNPRLL